MTTQCKTPINTRIKYSTIEALATCFAQRSGGGTHRAHVLDPLQEAIRPYIESQGNLDLLVEKHFTTRVEGIYSVLSSPQFSGYFLDMFGRGCSMFVSRTRKNITLDHFHLEHGYPGNDNQLVDALVFVP